MTEYWLQKKTIGGWSHVTYYVTEAEARINFNKVSGDLNGYCWRLVKAEVIEEKLLNDVVEIDPPKMYEEPLKTGIINQAKSGWGNLIPAIPKSNGWGDVPQSGWNSTTIDPKPVVLNSWGDLPADSGYRHKGTGKVCMINHVLKERTKVDANVVDNMIAQGWERGGPRTQFREK